MSHDFDGNEAFVLSIISFLKELGWLKEARDGRYKVTNKGRYILVVQDEVKEEENPAFDSDEGFWRY